MGTLSCPFCGALLPAKLALRPLGFLLSGLTALVLAAVVLWARVAAEPKIPGLRPALAVQPDAAPAPAPPPAPSLALLAPEEPPLQIRWAATWVHVRHGPEADAPVVAILTPGQPVNVRPDVGSRWLVYRGGKPLGYVARWLLRDTP